MGMGTESDVRRWRADFPTFARECLVILNKDGKLVPFEFNRAQIDLYGAMIDQMAEFGKVDVMINKARQMGFSTEITGYYFWLATFERGRQILIAAHKQDSTAHLAGMVHRYIRNIPVALRRPLDKTNQQEIKWTNRETAYTLQTAAGEEIARSMTISAMHLSELGLWKNANKVFAALSPTFTGKEGSYKAIESTSNGMGNLYHRLWQIVQSAMAMGDMSTIAKFYPWFWEPGYAEMPPDGFDLANIDVGHGETAEDYANMYGLDERQMAWYVRMLEKEFQGNVYIMRQEYPANAAESFQGGAADSLVPSNLIMRARRTTIPNVEVRKHPIIMGVDPARPDKELDPGKKRHDRFAIIRRQGPKVYGLETRNDLDGPDAALWIAQKVRDERIAMVCIDAGGAGGGDSVVDSLVRMEGMSRKVMPVNFSEGAIDRDKYDRRREEMWGDMRDWFKSKTARDIPDSDELHSDIQGPSYKIDYGKLKLQSKHEMRSKGVRSPDTADPLALTFAVKLESGAAGQAGMGAFVPDGGAGAGWLDSGSGTVSSGGVFVPSGGDGNRWW